VVLALVLVPITGLGAAQTTAGNQSYVAVQDGECTPITSFSGNESAVEFYDYRAPFPDNPYINTTGDAFGSEGTIDLQQANTSIVFIYTDTNGTAAEADDTVSLVFVHGNEANNESTGGAATFDIRGLPEDGNWTVKDDEYDGPRSYDNWSADSGDTVADWTWGQAATDGGVYSGLNNSSTVRVQPAFNEDAALYGEFYDGDVEAWQVLSNESTADNESTDTVTRTTLNRNQTLLISAESCSEVADGDDTTADDDDDRNGDEETPETPEDDEATPETPESGETTDTPVTPDTPEENETPETPEDGDDDTPETPVTPVTPETSKTPDDDTPVTPETPETPEDDTPVTPEDGADETPEDGDDETPEDGADETNGEDGTDAGANGADGDTEGNGAAGDANGAGAGTNGDTGATEGVNNGNGGDDTGQSNGDDDAPAGETGP